jgi:hypothetical protein
MNGDIVERIPYKAVEQLRAALGGSPLPIQRGQTYFSADDTSTYYVAYSDTGNVRTIVGAFVANVDIAYIDLELWRDYSNSVIAQLRAMEESEQAEQRKAQKEL